jgi:hypothetical protein
MNEGGTLLPYRSEFGMRFGKSISEVGLSPSLGEVRIEDGHFTLVGVDGILAACPVRDVVVSPVRIWCGDGMRLDLGAEGRWYVKPPFRSFRVKAARRDTRGLIDAIAEAQRVN